MIHWIVQILVTAVTLVLAAKAMPKVEVRNFTTALIVAVLIGIIGFLIGWLLTFVLHVATLGLFYLLGLSFIIRIVVYAIVIEIVDKFMDGFNTKGFLPSLWLSIIIAIAGAIVDGIFF
jgi:putative membrane protein